VPLAAAGIACLGFIPTFGGPDRPLHWAMTAGMVGFGALLWTRHRLLQRRDPSLTFLVRQPQQAARRVLTISALCTVLVCVIVGAHWHAGKPIGLLSVAMPLVGMSWLTAIGLRIGKLREAPLEGAASSDRPSRRPPKRESLTPPPQNQDKPASNRHASA